MLYKIVRPLARILLKASFRKIHFYNQEVIPRDKPVILAANHPTAFIEPCILATMLPTPLHFIVRGDLFVKPFYKKILKALHMVPIYRLKDGGYKKLKNNYDTFQFCHEALNEKKTILILAEGSTLHEKRLRPLRKGTARIVFGAIESYGELDIHIVPVGVNYTYADQLREEAMFEFGEPIRVLDYLATYRVEPNRATRELLEELRKRLEKRVIIIEDKKDDELAEQLFVLHRNDQPEPVFPIVNKSNKRLYEEKKIANWVNQLKESKKEKVKEKANDYFQYLDKLGLSDASVAQVWQARFVNTLILLIGFIPYLLGTIGNFIPFLIANKIVDTKVKAIEFKASVRLTVGMVLYILYLIVLVIIGMIVNHPVYWAFLVLLPFWAYFATLYQELYTKWRAALAFGKVDLQLQEDLKSKRQQLKELMR